jgi:hypothetical protein
MGVEMGKIEVGRVVVVLVVRVEDEVEDLLGTQSGSLCPPSPQIKCP